LTHFSFQTSLINTWLLYNKLFLKRICSAGLHIDFFILRGMAMVGTAIFLLPLSGDIWSMPLTLDNFFDILVLGAFYVIVGTVNCFSHSWPSILDAID